MDQSTRLTFLIVFGQFLLSCGSPAQETSRTTTPPTPKTHFGRALDQAHQVDKLNDAHNQALKEQAEGL